MQHIHSVTQTAYNLANHRNDSSVDWNLTNPLKQCTHIYPLGNEFFKMTINNSHIHPEDPHPSQLLSTVPV